MAWKVGTKCVLMSDAWDTVDHYKVVENLANAVSLRKFSDHFGNGPVRQIALTDADQLFVSPYLAEVFRSQPRTYAFAALIDDLSGALLGAKQRIPVVDLIVELKKDARLAKVPAKFLEGCLRSCVASGQFSVISDGRKTIPIYELELSVHRKQHERNRVFAGTFAHELQALSERVRSLIQHTGTVGTYRECLLQTLLRKHLPERYHVATGFIHGCRRQLDVLIYDRIDYAPLFREGDLVVVPRESVRAVIEVKTNLSKDELRKSLDLLDEVAAVDDLSPPFFRGIFGFESSISADQIFDSIEEFYVTEMPDDFAGIEDLGALPVVITEPFRHLSCVCVLGHSYAQVDFLRDGKNQYVPILRKASSATGLDAQAAHFLQHLLAYLRFGGLKATGIHHIEQFLGADTRWETHGQLTNRDDWGWGAYFARDHMDAGDEEVKMLEQFIEDVKRWLKGTPWNLPQGDAADA